MGRRRGLERWALPGSIVVGGVGMWYGVTGLEEGAWGLGACGLVLTLGGMGIALAGGVVGRRWRGKERR